MSKSIAILGGGISGLSAAYYLLNNSIKNASRIGKIYLIEKQSRVGGWLQSLPISNDDGHFELGPRTISLNSYAGNNVLSLVNSIGLADQVKPITKQSKSFKRRYVVIDGKLRLLPSSFSDLFIRKPPFKPFISYLMNDLRQPPVKLDSMTEDISVNDFFSQRFGEDVARYLINPLCIGITGGDSKQLSMRSVFASMFQDEQTKGSIVKSMFFNKKDLHRELRDDPLIQRSIEEKWAVFSFKNGIETLPKQLKTILSPKVEFMLETNVDGIEFLSSNKCQIDVTDNQNVAKQLQVDHCFSSIPAIYLSQMIQSKSFNLNQLQSILSSIKPINMAVVCIQFDEQLIPNDMGFGFLVPSIENSNILGVTFDSCMFDEAKTKMTIMLGGYMFEKLFGPPEQIDHDRLIDISLKELKKIMNIDRKPCKIFVGIHRDCIPQYTLGHQLRLKQIEQEINDLPLSLLGSSYYGFSVPDTILNARYQAENFLSKKIELN